MGDPAFQKYDDENDAPSSAYERAKQQWGMEPSESDSGEPSDEETKSARERANDRWGMGGDDEKELSPEKLKEAESKTDPSPSKDKENPGEAKEKSWITNLKSRNNNAKSMKKKLAIGGGIGAAVIGVVVGMMAFLQPFFLTHIVESIENRVGQVPQYAIERRMEYYMNRYIIMRTLGHTGDSIDGDPRFTYLGDGFVKTIYTNWRGARIEDKMLQRGYRLRATVNPDLTPNGMRADNWVLERLDRAGNVAATQELDEAGARLFIKDFSRETTSSHRLWKRHTIRKLGKRYFGVPDWKPFEKTRNNARKSFREKKADLKKKTVGKVTGRVREKLPSWLSCLTEGGESCRNKRLNAPDDTPNAPNTSPDEDADTNRALDPDAPDVPGNPDLPSSVTPDLNLMNRLFAILEEYSVKEIIGQIAAGVGILNTISNIVQSVDSGAINSILYNRALQQYGAYAAPVLSMADQLRSGQNFDPEDLRVAADMFRGFQASPVYQATQASGQANASKSIHRDCNHDGDDTDSGDALAPGETVCMQKKALQDKTPFTNSPVWATLVSISNTWEDTVGRAFDWGQSVIDRITSALRIDDGLQSLMSALGIDRALAGAFQAIMNYVFGIVITGAEVGPDAYDATYAGIDGLSTSAGGGIGDRSEQDSTIGGGILNSGQVTAIKTEMQNQRDYELKNMGIFARYFSPDVPESLTSYAIINNPGVNASALQRFAGIFKISSLTSIMSNLSASKVSAASGNDNPFGYLNFGFSSDAPIFSAHNGDGMDPDEVRSTYKCDLPVDQRPQNQAFGRPTMANGDRLPFEVNTEGDPCMLEEAVVQAATMRFDGTYDQDIDEVETDSSNGGAVPPGTVTAADIVPIPGINPGCHRNIAANVTSMVNAAAADGVTLTGSCWRSPEQQIALRRAHCGTSQYDIYEKPSGQCSPPTAIPGTSNHERGLAIDFDNCNSRGTASFIWLSQNAGRFGMYNLPSEPWHWSVDGG